MQLVYISNRPAILNNTMLQVSRYMPFIDSLVVICPGNIKEQFHTPTENISLLVIPEEEFIENSYHDFNALNHQSKNYWLRTTMIKHETIQPEFIMSDDDSRPIKQIAIDEFKQGGKYRRYYFYDLDFWYFSSSDFDRGQRITNIILQHYHMEHLSYASHMPQIINRDIFLEAADFYRSHAVKYPLCEWSTFFNYAAMHYPDFFLSPEQYRTLGWPDYPCTWPYYVRPTRIIFENYYPSMYRKNGLFHGLNELPSPEETDEVTIEKKVRLAELEAGRIKMQLHPKDPWRRKTIGHHLATKMAYLTKNWLRLQNIEQETLLMNIQKKSQD
jgi:hypothetical protein